MSDEDDLEVITKGGNVLLDYRAMVVDFIAGANGGTACVFAGQPFDTVKVKMQTFPTHFQSGFDCFMKTFRNERIRGLYAGTVPALVTQVAENSVLFLFYGRCLSVIQNIFNVKRPEDLSVVQKSCAGGIAAFMMSFIICPAELVKCKLQAQHQLRQMKQMSGKPQGHAIGPVGLTAQILKAEGILGFYRGFVSTCARESFGYIFFFGGYELSKNLLTPHGKTADEIGNVRVALSGGIAGSCFWTSVYPIDVVKSRIQTETTPNGKPDNFFRMILAIVRNEGFRTLYKGLGPAVFRSFPANGALFIAYEGTQRLLK